MDDRRYAYMDLQPAVAANRGRSAPVVIAEAWRPRRRSHRPGVWAGATRLGFPV